MADTDNEKKRKREDPTQVALDGVEREEQVKEEREVKVEDDENQEEAKTKLRERLVELDKARNDVVSLRKSVELTLENNRWQKDQDFSVLHKIIEDNKSEEERIQYERRGVYQKLLDISDPLPDPIDLKKLKLPELKSLAISRGVKGGRSWPVACPPGGKKQDIIDELGRGPDEPRPKVAGQGWVPRAVQELEDRCMDWKEAREEWISQGNDIYDFEMEEPDWKGGGPPDGELNERSCVNGIDKHEKEDVLEPIHGEDDNCHDYWCPICKLECDWREWHCAGCNKCRYGISIPCKTCTPGIYFVKFEQHYG